MTRLIVVLVFIFAARFVRAFDEVMDIAPLVRDDDMPAEITPSPFAFTTSQDTFTPEPIATPSPVPEEITPSPFALTPSPVPDDPTPSPVATPSAVPFTFPPIATLSPVATPSAVPFTLPSIPTLSPVATPSAVPFTFPTAVPFTFPTAVPFTFPTTVPFTFPTAVPFTFPTIPTLSPVATLSPIATPSPTSSPMSQLAPSNSPTINPNSISVISTIAGTGTASYSGDNGAATSATIDGPSGIVIDKNGNVYFAENNNHVIRKISINTGIISTYCGTGSEGYSNGVASSAQLKYPNGLAMDSFGHLYIGDHWNHAIRKINTTSNIITTIAGDGTSGSSGDNGDASSALLNNPIGVALDTSNNVYIADYGNNKIRKITISTGLITTIAGNGNVGYSTATSMAATSIELQSVHGISLDRLSSLYHLFTHALITHPLNLVALVMFTGRIMITMLFAN